MLKQRNEQIQILAIGLDSLICFFAFIAAFAIRFPMHLNPINWEAVGVVSWIFAASIVIHYFVYPSQKFYTSLRLKSWDQIGAMVIQAFLIEFFVLGGLVFFFQAKDTSRKFFIIFLLINYVLILIEKLSVRFLLLHVRQRGYNVRHLIVIGTQGPALSLERILGRHAHWGYQIEKFLRAPGEPEQGIAELPAEKIGGDWTSLEAELKQFPYDEVYISSHGLNSEWVLKVIETCDKIGLPTRIALTWLDPIFCKTTYLSLSGFPVVTYFTTLKTPLQAYSKRVLDVLVSLIGLGLTVVLYPWIAHRIRKESPGAPAIFKQYRYGENGRIFKCYKFRTMHPDAESLKKGLIEKNELSGPVFKLADDPRVFSFGKFLRQTSLDELPQFLNILRGDMSVVGTRPPTPDEVQLYSLEQRRRLSIRPGLTGLWQVSGRNDIRDFNEILKLDLRYIDQWSLWLDVKIIFKTLWIVFRRKGVS